MERVFLGQENPAETFTRGVGSAGTQEIWIPHVMLKSSCEMSDDEHTLPHVNAFLPLDIRACKSSSSLVSELAGSQQLPNSD